MGRLDGGLPITAPAIPGTHDTMTATCDQVYYHTQTLSLKEQLVAGVRFFDIRLRRTMLAAHREWVSDIDFAKILATVDSFLRDHPSEFVIMRVQNANEAKDDYPEYAQALLAQVSEHLELFHRFKTTEDGLRIWPTIDEVRGKIVAIECSPVSFDYSGQVPGNGYAWAANWHDNPLVALQDNWDGPTIEAKRDDIRALWSAPHPPQTLLLNHISATNGELGNPIAYADQLNPVAETLADALAEQNRKNQVSVSRADRPIQGRGVQIFDFVTPELAASVIAINNLA
jgi:1-phosphatidylinositol phosphodiesterase